MTTPSLFDPPPADTPALRLVPRDAVFPSTWRAESVAWARRRNFAQAQIDALEADLRRFRSIRDSYNVAGERAA